MPDYDPKSIPVLDDIIEDESDKTADAHDEIINCDEGIEDDGTLDLFSDVSTDIEIEQPEPAIGSIEKFVQHDNSTDVDAGSDDVHDETAGSEVVLDSDAADTAPGEIPDDTLNEADGETEEIEIIESALIDYPQAEAEEERIAETLDGSPALIEETSADDIEEEQPESQTDTSEAAPVVDLDSVVDSVVTQLMPELEQKLHALVRQALQEQLPEDILDRLSPASPSENDDS